MNSHICGNPYKLVQNRAFKVIPISVLKIGATDA